ncbi:hypothetical protein ACE193_12845 [Bernardetia sp. OM2101]|uniref:hypothetical protein n=1 Tax=Bernardetia sp. OM2101 TaxID=3344876 RepID=UPI0035CF294C
MTNTHHLETELHSEFLKQGRIDPITGEEIEEGHTIVICSACKSAFFIESWEYLGQTHCNQTETLAEIPKPKNMFLKAKPLEYLPFLFKKGNQDVDNTIHSLSENAIILGLVLAFMTVLTVLTIFIGKMTHPLVGLFFVIASIGSITYFLNKKTSKTFLKREINPNRATHIAFDMKAQGITIKKKTQKETIKFDQIAQLNYYVEYVSNSDSNNQCALSIRIETPWRKGTTYYTLLPIEEIPKWSEFLEQLPYSLKVMNVK